MRRTQSVKAIVFGGSLTALALTMPAAAHAESGIEVVLNQAKIVKLARGADTYHLRPRQRETIACSDCCN
jgi:hypothetical protein